ncbi:cation efflux protein [Limtongia smithiae]|uniref:cation efflux protein n=1 Tax=Limtongia smithiae TaxID=1125753 RepID=UPI0034CF1D5B
MSTVAGSSSKMQATTTAFEVEMMAMRPVPAEVGNVEAGRGSSAVGPLYTVDEDPLQLASKIIPDEDIRRLKARAGAPSSSTAIGGALVQIRAGGGGMVQRGKQALATRKLQDFYESQNETIQGMLRPVEEHARAARELNNENSVKYQIAVYGSFAANILLCFVQVYGAVSSGSLSLFTTMADAIFDPMSNLTLLMCSKALNVVNPLKFPAGKARLETAGNICFCFLMTSVSFIIIAFSVREITEGSETTTAQFHLPSTIAVCVAFVTKFVCFMYCFGLRNQVSQIRILWEDHRNDLLINGLGLAASVLGSKVRWWIDPMGAIMLSCLVSALWLHSAYGEFQLLIGVTADPKIQQLITYISMTHSPLIMAIETVRAYTSGPRLLVEVDIVMDSSATLRETHDVAEALQFKLEALPDVERAYVHVDYETTHKPEHFLKKEL